MNSIGRATISVPSSGDSRANVPMVTVIPMATIPTMCVVSFFMVISFSTFFMMVFAKINDYLENCKLTEGFL